MNDQLSFIALDRYDREQYARTQTRERALNAAIVESDVAASLLCYFEIFETFYDDDVEVSSEKQPQSVRGKKGIRPLITNFLVPLHIMAEIGGALVSVRFTSVSSDAPDQTHSIWTLQVGGISDRICTLSWRVLRKWRASRVVYEHHYEHRQNGEPLTSLDLGVASAISGIRLRRPSEP